MRTYVMVSGAIFAMLVFSHVARLYAEGAAVALEPIFAVTTALGIAMSGWAWYLLRRSKSNGRPGHA
jgi:hypothetical protein